MSTYSFLHADCQSSRENILLLEESLGLFHDIHLTVKLVAKDTHYSIYIVDSIMAQSEKEKTRVSSLTCSIQTVKGAHTALPPPPAHP